MNNSGTHTMISVQRMPEISSPACTEDINSNMIGAAIVGDSKSTKQLPAGKLLDNDTLLVILNTVLKTQQSSTRKVAKHQQVGTPCLTQSVQHTHTHPAADSTTTMVPPSTHLQALPRQNAAAEIDFKIEKAMDSVKMELLFTVRKEVKQLKSQVALLQIHNKYLEQENKILRSAAAPETLAKLSSQETGLPPSHTACTST